jgi:hypothetical protein
MQRGPEAQLAVIQKMYPDRRARILEDGKITIELTDSETGKPKEVIINPQGMEAADLMDLAAQTPEIAAGVAAGIMTRGTGFAKTAAQIVYSALAGAGTGAVRDVVSRGAEGIPIQFGEIAQARGQEAALDMFLSTSMLAGTKAMKAVSPFAQDIKAGSLEFDFQQGQKFFKEAFGTEIQALPSETTGSTALKALEAAETPQPGARTVMQQFREKRQAQVQNIVRRALGKVTPEEQIGEEAISTIRKVEVEPMENALKAARATAEQKGEQRVLDIIDNAIGTPRGARVTPSQAGAETIGAFETRLDEARSRVNTAYEQVRASNGGVEVMLDGSAAAQAAQEIRKELPKVVQGGESEVLKTGVPEGLLKSLDDLEKLDGSTVSLQTLTNMKTAAHDAIAAFRTAHGDVKDRWFSKIAGAYEKGIQDGIDQTGNPQLKAALTNARETYKKELLPFERPGLKELAKDEFDTGRLSAEQVATRLFEGPKAYHNFTLLKETLGADNPAFKVLKRSWVDSQIAEVSDSLTGSVDAQALAKKFTSLRNDHPELANEVFGRDLWKVISETELLAKFKKLKNLDEDAVEVLMTTPGVNASDVRAVVDMQMRRDKAYANKLIGDVADGLPIASKMKPTEFVRRIANADTPTKDVEKILDTLAKENPEAREAVATATLYRLLNEASDMEAGTATRYMQTDSWNVSPKKLAKLYGAPGSPERIRNDLLLGQGGVPAVPGGPNPTRGEFIENLSRLLSPQETKLQQFGGAGGLAQSQEILSLTRTPLKYASNYVKKMVLATLYTMPSVQKLTTNRVLGPAERAAIANTLIASEPFTRRVLEVTGDETMAGQIISEAKDSIDQYLSELTDSPEARDRRELEKLISGQPAKVTTPR